jgi:hypothetical protein
MTARGSRLAPITPATSPKFAVSPSLKPQQPARRAAEMPGLAFASHHFRQLARVHGRVVGDIDGRLVHLVALRLPREAEIRLHFSSLFAQDQRQHGGRAERLRDPRQRARAARECIRRQRLAGVLEQLRPARGVLVLDVGELLEQLAAVFVAFDLAESAIEPCGVALIGVVMAPRRIVLRRLGHLLSVLE